MKANKLILLTALAARFPQARALAAAGIGSDALATLREWAPDASLEAEDLPALAKVTDEQIHAFRRELDSQFVDVLPHGI